MSASSVSKPQLQASRKPYLTHYPPDPSTQFPLKVLYCGECGLPPEFCENSPDPARCKRWLESNLPDIFSTLYVNKPASASGSAAKPVSTSHQPAPSPDSVTNQKGAQDEEDQDAEGEEPGSSGQAQSRRQKRGGKGLLRKAKDEPSSSAADLPATQASIAPETVNQSAPSTEAGSSPAAAASAPSSAKPGKVKKEKPALIEVSRSQRSAKKWITTVKGLRAYGIEHKAAAKFFGGKFACGCSANAEADEVQIQGDVCDTIADVLLSKWAQIPRDLIRLPEED